MLRRNSKRLISTIVLCLALVGGEKAQKSRDWDEYLVSPTMVWPQNIPAGRRWGDQGMTKAEVVAVLNRPMPAINESNADLLLFEVISKAAGRQIVWVPAVTEQYEKWVDDKYGKDFAGKLKVGQPERTVGDALWGHIALLTEMGGPKAISVMGKPAEDDEDGPNLIYTVYVTKKYITIVAMPADGE